MNILVTGATGFVGTNLIKSFKYCHTVHALVRPTTDLSKVGTKYTFEFNDNIEELAAYLSSNQIEGIIHLASLCLAQHKPEQIKDLVLSNVYLGSAILEAAVKAKVKWFLNTGTIWQNYIPDSKEYCPVNLYAATKQAFIDLAKYYIETSAIRFCTLKLCDTYGPDDTRRKIFALFQQIAETGETLNMSPGDQKLDILHIDDVVRGFDCLASMLQNATEIENEYVLSSGEQYSLKELAKMFEKAMGKTLHINWGGRPYREREVMIPYKGNILPNWKVTKSFFIA